MTDLALITCIVTADIRSGTAEDQVRTIRPQLRRIKGKQVGVSA